MSLQARIIEEQFVGRRDDDRVSVGRACVLRAAGRPPVHSALLDLTRHGCRIRTGHPLGVGESVLLGLAGVGTVEATVMWGEGTQYGCEFIGTLPSGAVSDATRGNVVSFDVAPAAQPFKWSPRQRLMTLAVYAATPWLAIMAAIHLFRSH
ncbi:MULTISPECIES: PilZ domain-containing protein [unclassified Sphingomonas]|uniref:PilZ domain-containing protein n=1 Tax=unclassified Sphingomonas TaxID=196159 RepID=UPI000A4DB8E7|nr:MULTISPECIES: PilZ domain-containing protein [unclassified Sphingomonas]